MQTVQRIEVGDARHLASLADGSVRVIITSPPYPMIAMWDQVFHAMNPATLDLIDSAPEQAFEAMHCELDRVWAECARVLAWGGICCINVGDATRSVDGRFALYPNHARIIEAFRRLQMTSLPDVLWRKPTNAPNKFMGSGMLPGGAYVTYEHEYILIFRKGAGREFATPEEKAERHASAYFWEERNVWFSDVWEGIVGTRQAQDAEVRERSAAFPLEIPRRLILMHSVYGDVILDPFAGTGTTVLAAAALGRSGVGIEFDAGLVNVGLRSLEQAPHLGATLAQNRLAAHREFVRQREAAGKEIKHKNRHYGFAVITKQEAHLELRVPTRWVRPSPNQVVLELVPLREEAPHCDELPFE